MSSRITPEVLEELEQRLLMWQAMSALEGKLMGEHLIGALQFCLWLEREGRKPKPAAADPPAEIAKAVERVFEDYLQSTLARDSKAKLAAMTLKRRVQGVLGTGVDKDASTDAS